MTSPGKYNIEFKSRFGFVPAQTVNAALRYLRKIDPTSHEYLQRGWNGQATLIYLESELSTQIIGDELTKFIQKYDHLYFYLGKKA
jgi:hypothetical protein